MKEKKYDYPNKGRKKASDKIQQSFTAESFTNIGRQKLPQLVKDIYEKTHN